MKEGEAMKKLLGVFAAFLFAITLVACGAKTEKSSVYVLEQNGVNIKLTYFYVGDKVTKQYADNEMPYSSFGATNKEEAKTVLGDLESQYADVKGIEHRLDYQDDRVIESLKMDLENLDFEKASKLQGVMLDAKAENGVSMKLTEETLLNQGFEKVED